MNLQAEVAPADAEATRHAGREALSLWLIGARNRLLALLNEAPDPHALRTAVRVAHFQEHWIGCHVQRQRGEACDPTAPRLAGIEPLAPSWARDGAPLPDVPTVRAYLEQTLEITLDLLAAAAPTDAALHVYRAALWHEDRAVERLVEARGAGAPPGRTPRGPLQVAACRWQLGSAPGGFAPHNERWVHAVAVPAFEIDALPVSWAAFAPFAEDGGYDRRSWWSETGWAWVQAQQRRAPRYVEQLVGAVLLRRGEGSSATLQRASPTQPATHLSRFEAEAWCRWAGRRLPTEPEWEIAACTLGRAGAPRGFVWGDVHEWVAGSARLWPGAGAAPAADDTAVCESSVSEPATGQTPSAVLRGASFITVLRWHHPKARRFVRADHDLAHCGFRSCAP